MEADAQLDRFAPESEGPFQDSLPHGIENYIRDHERKRMAKQRGARGRQSFADAAAPGWLEPCMAASDTSPSSAAARLESRERLAGALRQLPHLHREVLVLRHPARLTFAEIAGASR